MNTIKRKGKSKMRKIYLNELTSEELKTLFRKNEHLQELANELHRDNVMFWIDEELGMFTAALSDWQLGFDCYSYIRVKDSALFIQCFKEYNASYSNDDQTIALVDEAVEYLASNYEADDYDEKIEEFANKLKRVLVDYFNNCITYSSDEDELIEYLDNGDLLENYYLMADDSSVIYEEIIKRYK